MLTLPVVPAVLFWLQTRPQVLNEEETGRCLLVLPQHLSSLSIFSWIVLLYLSFSVKFFFIFFIFFINAYLSPAWPLHFLSFDIRASDYPVGFLKLFKYLHGSINSLLFIKLQDKWWSKASSMKVYVIFIRHYHRRNTVIIIN